MIPTDSPALYLQTLGKAYRPRVCAECGVSFLPHNGRQRFCTVEHKRRFWKVMEVRGRLLMPFGLADRGLTHSRDPDRKALSTWSRSQKDGMLRRWAQDDRKAGRDASLIAAQRKAECWSYVDVDTP